MYAKVSRLCCEGRNVQGTLCFVKLSDEHFNHKVVEVFGEKEDRYELTAEGKAYVETKAGDDWRYQTVWVVTELDFIPPVY